MNNEVVGKRYSIANVQTEDLLGLKRESFKADDMMMVGLCAIALEGKVDFGKWATLTAFEARMLEVVSQLDALRMCVSVLNENEVQKAQKETA